MELRREQPARSTRMLVLLLEQRFPQLQGRPGDPPPQLRKGLFPQLPAARPEGAH